MNSVLSNIWQYRGFISGSVKREFQSKYRNSLLGAAWTVINPLAMILIYTVIFSQVMRARLPGVDSTFAYSIYLNDRIPETDYLTFGDYMWIGALISIFSIIIGRLASLHADRNLIRNRIEFASTALAVGIYFAVLLTAIYLSFKTS